MLVSSLYLINYHYTQTLYDVYNEVILIYERLEAEKDIFDEILFKLYIYDYDDFHYVYNDYEFKVNMSETEIKIKVINPNKYSIEVVYDDDCLCFINVKSSALSDE